MTIEELNTIYPIELSLIPGDNDLRFKLLSPLFQNLFENKIIYHERFTCLAQLSEIELTPSIFKAKVKRLSLIYACERIRHLVPEEWEIGAIWPAVNLKGNRLGTYGGWIIWTDPKLVEQILNLTKDDKMDEAYNLTMGELH